MSQVWLEYCKYCGRKHRVIMRDCPECGVHQTPQPKSDTVLEQCWQDYACDGCQAYREHTT